MLHDADAAGVASAGDHAHVADLELDRIDRLSALQVDLDRVVNLDKTKNNISEGKKGENTSLGRHTNEQGKIHRRTGMIHQRTEEAHGKQQKKRFHTPFRSRWMKNKKSGGGFSAEKLWKLFLRVGELVH